MVRSDYFILAAAFISFLFSVSLWFGVFGGDASYNKQAGLFVGLWVPSILALGSFVKFSQRGAR